MNVYTSSDGSKGSRVKVNSAYPSLFFCKETMVKRLPLPSRLKLNINHTRHTYITPSKLCFVKPRPIANEHSPLETLPWSKLKERRETPTTMECRLRSKVDHHRSCTSSHSTGVSCYLTEVSNNQAIRHIPLCDVFSHTVLYFILLSLLSFSLWTCTEHGASVFICGDVVVWWRPILGLKERRPPRVQPRVEEASTSEDC